MALLNVSVKKFPLPDPKILQDCYYVKNCLLSEQSLHIIGDWCDSDIILETTVSLEDFQSGVREIVSRVKPNWDLDLAQFKVFTEGISNQLMGIFYPNDPPGILVRVYGVGTELFVDRQAEQDTMLKLAIAGLGPNLLATFRNGLVYHYVPGTVLTVENVHQTTIWPAVARKLGCMHRLESEKAPALWLRLHKFLDLIPESLFQKYSSLQRIFPNKIALAQEVNWLQSKLQKSSNPIVFCHNDLLLANVVIESESHVTFIDYEYASANYQAFDIANHFNEYAGVDNVDYSRLPSESYQKEWLREYLGTYLTRPPTEEDLNTLLLQVKNFTPASHMLWGLWSLVQAQFSQIAFDFAGYALIRFDEYVRSKSVI